jgi:hypothetical protein
MLWIADASFVLGLILFLTGVGRSSTSYDPDAGTGQMLFGSSLLSRRRLRDQGWQSVPYTRWRLSSDQAAKVRRHFKASRRT